MPPYAVEYETNAATVTTSATGAGTITVAKLSQLAAAVIAVPGYVAAGIVVSGQNIAFQLYQASTVGGALIAPTSAVSFDPGAITILEVGN